MESKPDSSTSSWPLHHLLFPSSSPGYVSVQTCSNDGLLSGSISQINPFSLKLDLWSWCFVPAIETLTETLTFRVFQNSLITVTKGRSQDLLHTEQVLYHKLPSWLLVSLHHVSFNQELWSIMSREKDVLGGSTPFGA